MKFTTKRILTTIGISIMLMPLLIYGILYLLRPQRTNLEQTLFPGVSYQRQKRSQPRSLVLHIIAIDLNTPGIKFLATPGQINAQGQAFTALTTSEFLRSYQVQLAINGSLFFPPSSRNGDGVDVLGLSISGGITYSEAKYGWPVVCILPGNQIQIREMDCPDGTTEAIAGSNIVVKDGEVVTQPIGDHDVTQIYPRTAVALDQKGTKLWLIVVDGRQFRYSEGVSLTELGQIMVNLGAYQGLNLDGGGSTSMVMDNQGRAKVLNAPINGHIPMRQRPVANHLGIYIEQ